MRELTYCFSCEEEKECTDHICDDCHDPYFVCEQCGKRCTRLTNRLCSDCEPRFSSYELEARSRNDQWRGRRGFRMVEDIRRTVPGELVVEKILALIDAHFPLSV